MKQNSALVSTALLSAIFDEKKQDNISLLIPFVIKIIYDNPKITEEEIASKMVEMFSFTDFPRAIVRIIINRMRKKNIIKREENLLVFVNDMTKSVDAFNRRLEDSKKKIDLVVNSLVGYFKSNTTIKMTYADCKTSFARFLDKNGYLLYENINNLSRTKNKDRIHYHIGLFIKLHKQLDDIIYSYLVEIIEGSLIANAIYVNVDNDTKDNLSNLTCYFDTSFMLRVLEYKDPKDNESALELVNLLKQQKAKIKCFSNNFDEIENILEEFIRNYGTIQEKTLENLILKGYSEVELRGLLLNLKEQINELGIEIVDPPEYKEDEYKFVIDEKKLQENMEKLYSEEKKNPRIIENDVASISAIMRIRKGKEYSRIEECPAIFVTMNIDLRRETNSLLNLDEVFKVSPAISDIDLTAILWLKSLATHKYIPEMKLTENALAALKPTPNIKSKFNESIQRLQSKKIQITNVQLHNLLCSNYYRENLMDAIDGDLNRLNPTVILNTYESTLEKKDILEKNSKELEEKNSELVKKLFEKENQDQTYKNNVYSMYARKEEIIKSVIEIIEKGIPLLLFALLCYIYYNYSTLEDPSDIVKLIIVFIGIYSFISTFFPVSIFSLINTFFGWINSYLFVYIHNWMVSLANKEIKSIFKE